MSIFVSTSAVILSFALLGAPPSDEPHTLRVRPHSGEQIPANAQLLIMPLRFDDTLVVSAELTANGQMTTLELERTCLPDLKCIHR